MHVGLSNSERKRLLKPVWKAIMEYKMIEDGDRVAVGLSGGKDSSTLFYLLSILQKQLPIRFELVPITLTMGFEGFDIQPLKDFVEALGYELHIKETFISQIVFDIRKEKSPCSLCANLRRGKIIAYAKELGCNKLAYGHHLDDGIETFFMNLFFAGKLGVFTPVTWLDRSDITVIRPMIAVEERHIIQFVEAKGIPVLHNPCPANGKTKREEMKELVKQLSAKYPDLRQNFLHGATHINVNDFWRIHS